MSPDFSYRVLKAVELFENRRTRRTMLAATGLLLASLVILVLSGSAVFEGLQSGEADGLLSIVWNDPSMLLVTETWMAMLQQLPLLAMGLALVSFIGCAILLTRFATTISPRHQHAAA